MNFEQLKDIAGVIGGVSGAVAAVAALLTVKHMRNQAVQDKKDVEYRDLVSIEVLLEPARDALVRMIDAIDALPIGDYEGASDQLKNVIGVSQRFYELGGRLDWEMRPSAILGVKFLQRCNQLIEDVQKIVGGVGRTWTYPADFYEEFCRDGDGYSCLQSVLRQINALHEDVLERLDSYGALDVVRAGTLDRRSHAIFDKENPIEDVEVNLNIIKEKNTKKTAYWGRLFEDAFRAGGIILGALTALAGICISSLLGGDVSPSQVKYAQLLLGQTGELIAYALVGIVALYLVKTSDFNEIIATPPREWVMNFLQNHPGLSWIPSVSISVMLALSLLISIAYPIGMPIFIGIKYLGFMPRLNNEVRCEVEYVRSLQITGYRSAEDCADIILSYRSRTRADH